MRRRKFPLRGFIKFICADFVKLKSENRIMPDGVNAKLLGCHGPSTNRQPGRAFLASTVAEASQRHSF